MMEPAVNLVMQADIFLVVGTSLSVYPAASLLQFVRPDAEKYIVTLDLAETPHRDFVWLKQKASMGVPALVAEWLQDAAQ
jgi:NAD-dependent deacetylase